MCVYTFMHNRQHKSCVKDYAHPYMRVSMWEIVPENLRTAMERAGINQTQLAEAVGMKQPSIGRLLTGFTKTTRAVDQIAAALGTTPAFLKGEVDSYEQNEGFTPTTPIISADKDTVEIVEFQLSYGLGASFIHDDHAQSKVRTFTREWLRYFTDSPFDKLMFARGIGDSMMPTILDADIVLIDTQQRTPRLWDQLWAVDMGGMGMIKRLRPTKDGQGMQLISSNPDVPNEEAYDGEMNIVGRVVAIVRKM